MSGKKQTSLLRSCSLDNPIPEPKNFFPGRGSNPRRPEWLHFDFYRSHYTISGRRIGTTMLKKRLSMRKEFCMLTYFSILRILKPKKLEKLKLLLLDKSEMLWNYKIKQARFVITPYILTGPPTASSDSGRGCFRGALFLLQHKQIVLQSNLAQYTNDTRNRNSKNPFSNNCLSFCDRRIYEGVKARKMQNQSRPYSL